MQRQRLTIFSVTLLLSLFIGGSVVRVRQNAPLAQVIVPGGVGTAVSPKSCDQINNSDKEICVEVKVKERKPDSSGTIQESERGLQGRTVGLVDSAASLGSGACPLKTDKNGLAIFNSQNCPSMNSGQYHAVYLSRSDDFLKYTLSGNDRGDDSRRDVTTATGVGILLQNNKARFVFQSYAVIGELPNAPKRTTSWQACVEYGLSEKGNFIQKTCQKVDTNGFFNVPTGFSLISKNLKDGQSKVRLSVQTLKSGDKVTMTEFLPNEQEKKIDLSNNTGTVSFDPLKYHYYIYAKIQVTGKDVTGGTGTGGGSGGGPIGTPTGSWGGPGGGGSGSGNGGSGGTGSGGTGGSQGTPPPSGGGSAGGGTGTGGSTPPTGSGGSHPPGNPPPNPQQTGGGDTCGIRVTQNEGFFTKLAKFFGLGRISTQSGGGSHPPVNPPSGGTPPSSGGGNNNCGNSSPVPVPSICPFGSGGQGQRSLLSRLLGLFGLGAPPIISPPNGGGTTNNCGSPLPPPGSVPPGSPPSSGVTLVGAGNIVNSSFKEQLKASLSMIDYFTSIRKRNLRIFTLGNNDNGLSLYEGYDQSWGGPHTDLGLVDPAKNIPMAKKYITRPSLGRREYALKDAKAYFDYFMNKNGKDVHDLNLSPDEVAGPDKKGYYSYDAGGWHMVVLNTNCYEGGLGEDGCDANSSQVTWLKSDLAKNQDKCMLAYWYDPIVTASHVSLDTAAQVQKLTPLWNEMVGKVDIALMGRDGNYQRFKRLGQDRKFSDQGIVPVIVGTGGGSPMVAINPGTEGLEVGLANYVGVLHLELNGLQFEGKFWGVPFDKPYGTVLKLDAFSGTCHGGSVKTDPTPTP